MEFPHLHPHGSHSRKESRRTTNWSSTISTTNDALQVRDFACSWYKFESGGCTVQSTCVHRHAHGRSLPAGDGSICGLCGKESPSHRQRHQEEDEECQEVIHHTSEWPSQQSLCGIMTRYPHHRAVGQRRNYHERQQNPISSQTRDT